MAALMLIAAGRPATAAPVPKPSVEIVDWGIVERAPVVGSEPSDTLVGRNHLIDPNAEIEMAERTLNVPACIGVRFGVLFRATGRAVPVTVVVSHPEQVAPDGRRTSVSRWQTEARSRRLYTGWRFEQPFELVPGDWTISLQVAGRVVAARTFTVRADACALTS